MLCIAVVNLKGGSTKTTSAAYLLHALAESGLSVLGVDADPENCSLVRWSDLAEWATPVVGMPVKDLHRRLDAVSEGFEAVVIDTPPMESGRGIVTSAVRVATHIVIPMSPTPMDFDRLGAVLDLIDDVGPLRTAPPVVAALLTRVVTNSASGEVYRTAANELVPVLPARVARLERFAQAFGCPIDDALNTAYGDALTQLLDMEVAQR
ncbi:ParA family protein [Gordonia sp. i37]|uniref:ParA family protein n=1 Tax=Gordonia sp. i37 TaxID=1961707 RepID=UPI0009AEE6F5|nr:ParA family protein [Gordonia sp. i37]OPX09361.1 chromosome partitioning protein [Gordonia sp. i37]